MIFTLNLKEKKMTIDFLDGNHGLYYDYVEDYLNHHEALVKRLAKPGEWIRETLTPEGANLWHMGTGVCTESGEIMDTVKKHVIYQQVLDRGNLVEEIGDLLFYVQGILSHIDVPLHHVLAKNIQKLEQRYGPTYSDEAAKERKDK